MHNQTENDGFNDLKSDSYASNSPSLVDEEEKVQLEQPLLRPTHTLTRRKRKPKDDNPISIICEWAVEHQIGLSVNLLLLLGLTHLSFPKARPQTRKFVELSYYNPESGNYTSGWDDARMVAFWIIFFTAARASTMDFLLKPFGQWAGVKNRSDQVRFAEQGWLLLYYCVFYTLGMYLMWNSNYWFNIRDVWRGWPNREIGGLLKWYILVQFAFWVQQILVINIEKRRKDHWQMFSHHIVSCILLFTSYGYHQTKIANVILCLMDVVDLFLPVAKCLKYMDVPTLPDIVFGIFMVTWFICRHVFYMIVCFSVWRHLPEETVYGCYRGKTGSMEGPFPKPDVFGHLIEPFTNPQGVICFNNQIKWGFLTCLLFLQFLTLWWFWMVVKVAIKVLRGGNADDIRSDSESSEEELEDVTEFEKADTTSRPIIPFEEEVGVEAINLKGRGNASGGVNGKRSKNGSISSSSGVKLPGNSKELLGRIGCERGV